MKCDACAAFLHPNSINALAIKCPRCLEWFHLGCTGIDPDYYEYFKTEARKAEGDKWICRSCLGANELRKDDTNNARDSLNNGSFETIIERAMQTAMRQLKTEIMNAVRSEIDATNKRIDKVEKQQQAIMEKINKSGASANDREELMYVELEERERRKRNIMVFGLPESKSKETSGRKEDDTQAVQNMLREIGVQVKPVTSFRIGKVSDSPRPLKVVLPDQSSAIEIMKRSRDNKNGDVVIKPDLISNQIKYLNDLRTTLNARKSAGESNITIKYVNGRPVISKMRPKLQKKSQAN